MWIDFIVLFITAIVNVVVWVKFVEPRIEKFIDKGGFVEPKK